MAEDDLRSPTRLPVPSHSSQLPKADGSRRRSLLLPKGTMVAAAQRGALSPTKNSKQRAMTMYGAGDMQSLAALSAQFAADSDTSRASSPEKKDARAAAHARLTGDTKSTDTKSKIGLGRSQSVRKQAPTADTTRPPKTRSHARNPSTTGHSSRPLSTLVEKSSRSSRPESSASTSSKSTSDGAAPRSKPPASSQNNGTSLRRSATTSTRHTRTQSALPTASSAGTSSSSGLPRLEIRRHPTISEGAPSTGIGANDPKLRPAFSTLQQHYSPRKNTAPKPASSSLIHAQPAELVGGSALGLEVQFLQARLLQLSILHRESAPAFAAWEDSAKRKLERKFATVAKQCAAVEVREREARKRGNINALKEWAAGGDAELLAEQVQVLAGVVNEVMQLVGPEGRVEGVMEVFEEWIDGVEGVWNRRSGSGGSGGKEDPQDNKLEFIESLGETWKHEAHALLRRLGSIGRVLDGMHKPRQGSGPHGLIMAMAELITKTMGELRCVVSIEEEVVRREKGWVDGMVDSLEEEGVLEALLGEIDVGGL